VSLGAQQGKVCLVQDRLGIRAVSGVHADTHARSDVQGQAIDRQRRGNRGEQVVRAERRILRTGHFRQQDDEFIAAVAAHGVRPAHARHQPACNHLKDTVPDRMAVPVVDALEPIDVQE